MAGPIPGLSKWHSMGPPPRGITVGPMPSGDRLRQGVTDGIHPEDVSVIMAVPIPRTEGGFIGQGNRIKDQADELHREQQRQSRHRH